MTKRSVIYVCLCAALGFALLQAPTDSMAQGPSPNVQTFSGGLHNPRGLKFGPDGNLYVAEGGLGGSIHTDSKQCDQVPDAGPYSGDFNARISKIDKNGVRSTVVDGLPSSQTQPGIGSLVSGVADVAFIGNTLYGLLAGAPPTASFASTTTAPGPSSPT